MEVAAKSKDNHQINVFYSRNLSVLISKSVDVVVVDFIRHRKQN